MLVAKTHVLGIRERSLYASEVMKFVQANTSAGGKDLCHGHVREKSILQRCLAWSEFLRANTSAGGKDIVVGAGRLVSTLCWEEQELPNGNSCFFYKSKRL